MGSVPLAGSVQPTSFTVTANAPAGSTVKIKLDGTYIGSDSTAPYAFALKAAPGTHKVNVRWDVSGVTKSYDVVFTVK